MHRVAKTPPDNAPRIPEREHAVCKQEPRKMRSALGVYHGAVKIEHGQLYFFQVEPFVENSIVAG